MGRETRTGVARVSGEERGEKRIRGGPEWRDHRWKDKQQTKKKTKNKGGMRRICAWL